MALRQRAAVVRIVDHGESSTVIDARGVTRRFEGDSAALLRAVLELHEHPIDRAALLAALGERAGGPVPEGPVDELLGLLETAGVLVVPRDERVPR
nr:hypothetical protein [Myxococcota bacterium]